MKILLAGAFGNLGAEILKALDKAGHEVVAADLGEGKCDAKYSFRAIDATNPDTLKGIMDGCDMVISTVGLCLYLILSFATGAWYITWVIFPMMAAAQGLAKAILDLKEVN